MSKHEKPWLSVVIWIVLGFLIFAGYARGQTAFGLPYQGMNYGCTSIYAEIEPGKPLLYTAGHCTDFRYWGTLAFSQSGKTYAINLAWTNPDIDIAAFHISGIVGENLTPVKPALKPPNIGDKVHFMATPQDMGLLYFEGYYSGVAAYNNLPLVITQADIGTSGAGILNESGELIGIITQAFNSTTQLTGGFYVPVEDIKRKE